MVYAGQQLSEAPRRLGRWGLEPSGQKGLISELMGFFVTSLVILNM